MPRQESSADFEDVWASDGLVGTTKPDEFARVRITKMTSGDRVRHWMSIGTFVESDSYQGWGRGASVKFDNPDDIDALIEELDGLRDEWKRRNLSTAPKQAETVKLVRKGSAATEAPKSIGKTPAKKAVSKKAAPRRRAS